MKLLLLWCLVFFASVLMLAEKSSADGFGHYDDLYAYHAPEEIPVVKCNKHCSFYSCPKYLIFVTEYDSNGCITCYCKSESLKGPVGLKGSPGLPGIAGADGKQGHLGPKGPKGADGEQGHPGIRGPKGPTGYPGHVGAKGADGADGPDGDDGNRGIAGATGAKGATGETGDQGLKGEQGEQGHPGPKGPKGPVGDPSWRGPPASKGGKGGLGEQGPLPCNSRCSLKQQCTPEFEFDCDTCSCLYKGETAAPPSLPAVRTRRSTRPPKATRCPHIRCTSFCEWGHKKDTHGCTICGCKTDPITTTNPF